MSIKPKNGTKNKYKYATGVLKKWGKKSCGFATPLNFIPPSWRERCVLV
jgi:hypothetical protein